MTGAARLWFIAGTVPLLVAGGAHALAALYDATRPTFFTPVDDSVRSTVDGTGIRLRRMFRLGDATRPSMWRVWLGIHVSHGLAIFSFALLCLLIVLHDATLVVRIPGLLPLTIAFSACYVALSVRFWFYGPLLVTAVSTLCFTVAAVLSA